MIFENPSVNIEELPQASSTQYTALQEDYIMVQLFNSILLHVVIVGIALFVAITSLDIFGSHPFLSILAIVLLMLCSLGAQVYLILAGFKYKGYSIRTHDVLYRSGLIVRREVAVPLIRVQHVEVKRGLFSRIFGLASLNIFTAGTGSIDLKIPGLTLSDANKLMAHLSKTISNER